MGAMKIFLLENGKGKPLFAVGAFEKEKLIDQAEKEKEPEDLFGINIACAIAYVEDHIKQKKGEISVHNKALKLQYEPGECISGEIHGFPSFLEELTLFYSIK